MGCGNNGGQQQTSQQSSPMPQQMAQQASSMPTSNNAVSQAVQQAQATAAAMKVLRDSGQFNTPYQNIQARHPFITGLADAAQTFGQGLTHQPFATQPQQSQADLQNTEISGMNNIATLPAQMRMMMAMQGIYGQPNQSQPTNIPGVTPVAPVISTPVATAQPQAQAQTNAQQWSKTPGGNQYRVVS